MKNTIGQQITLTLFGESHGNMIGCVVDGLPSGIEIDLDFMNMQMNKRRAVGSISTARQEKDDVKIVSGYYNNKTTGTPLTILIENLDVRSKDYSILEEVARPSHADYSAEMRYGGYQDKRGGGHFSGRLTAPIVASGSIALKMLEEKGIIIGTHISELHGVKDKRFSDDEQTMREEINKLNDMHFAVNDANVEKDMVTEIEKAKSEKDSVGGILETCILGVETGIGEPIFDSIESLISHALFSVGGVKGIEFGSGFELAKMKGSSANDEFYVEESKVKTKTNHNGGINGGITNGMPIIFRTVIKPTPSIGISQNTINYKQMKDTTLELEGRHDPAIIHRARVVQDSLIALVLVDILTCRKGYDWWNK